MESISRARKFYVIEHCEEYLFNWSKYEFEQMMAYLKPTNSLLIITNSNVFLKYKAPSAEIQDENDSNIESVKKHAKTIGMGDRFFMLPENFHDYTDDTKGTVKMPCLPDEVPFSRVCLLDLKGSSQLGAKEAKDNFDVFIVGGILGSHPPKDRTGPLRKVWLAGRHLGEMQFSTDNALLATKILAEDGIELKEIPVVDFPELDRQPIASNNEKEKGISSSVQLDFRYITTQYDYEKEIVQAAPSNVPILHEKIREILLGEEDFDIDQLMS
jgi:ribosome biogenesis SPOUT family RNA methylase Rps3